MVVTIGICESVFLSFLGAKNLTMEDLNCWTGSESTDEQQEHDEDAALGHLGRSEKEVCQIKWHYMALHWHFFKDKPADFEGCSIFRRNAKGNEESVASLIASGI